MLKRKLMKIIAVWVTVATVLTCDSTFVLASEISADTVETEESEESKTEIASTDDGTGTNLEKEEENTDNISVPDYDKTSDGETNTEDDSDFAEEAEVAEDNTQNEIENTEEANETEKTDGDEILTSDRDIDSVDANDEDVIEKNGVKAKIDEADSEETADDAPEWVGDALEDKTVTETVLPPGDFDNDDAFELYADSKLNENSLKGAVVHPGYDSLNKYERNAYNAIVQAAKEVAEGRRSSTEFGITYKQIYGKTKFVGGVDISPSNVAEATFDGYTYASFALMLQFEDDVDTQKIIHAIYADQPYVMYWNDKTSGCVYSTLTSGGYTYSENGKNVIEVDNNAEAISLSYVVDSKYASSRYAANTTKTSATTTAVNKAKTIVNNAASKSDKAKLDYYREQICSLVSYDYSGSDKGAWQLINVFDGNSSTNVVCEGYAKAFQYLCDLSNFSSPKIYSYMATGYAGRGTSVSASQNNAHMWNIVHMDDDKNYLVDVTWCDGDGVGRPDNTFLKGMSSGTTGTSYTKTLFSSPYTYVYDSATLSRLTKEQRTLSLTDYGTANNSTVTAISISPSTKIDLQVGESFTLSAVKTPVNSTIPLNWKSSNTAVAKVDASGTVTGVSPGNAVITAYVGNVNANCMVTVVNGAQQVIPNNANGVIQLSDGNWYYVKNGVIQSNYTGFQDNSNGRWRIENGKVNFNYKNVVYEANQWRFYSGGSWQKTSNSVEQNSNGWWKLKNGVVDFSYTGFADNANGRWRIENGKVNFSYKNVVNESNQWRFYSGGQWQKASNSVEQNSNGWWKLKNGVVDFTYTGFADNANGRWRIENGKVNFNYRNVVNESNQWRFYSGGQWQKTSNSVEQNSNGWWKLRNGVVDFSYTGFADNANGRWRIENGKVNFSYKNVVNESNQWRFYSGGQWQKTSNSVEQNSNGWWKLRNGVVDFSYTGIGSNSNGRWYCKNGKVDFSYTGRIYWNGSYYNIRNGKVM